MAVGNASPYMGYNSALVIAKQATLTTFVSAGSFVEFNSESMKQEREELKLESINNTRDYTRRLIGNEALAGSVEMDLNVAEDACVNLIKQAMGGTAATAIISAAVSFAHTIYTGDMENNAASAGADDMKGLSLGVRKGGTNTWNFSAARVNTLTLTGEVGSPVVMAVDLIAHSVTTSLSVGASAVSFSTVNPVNFTGITVNTGDSITNAATEEFFTGFELTINNNLVDDVRSLGGRNINQLPPTKREVILKLSSRFDTLTSYNRFTGNTLTAIQLTLDSEQTITSGETTNSMIIKLPDCRYNSNMPEAGDNGVLAFEVEAAAMRGSEAGYSVNMVITNGTSDYD